MSVWDFRAQKSPNSSKLLLQSLCFFLKLEINSKINLQKLGNASQRGEVLPGCPGLPLCRLAAQLRPDPRGGREQLCGSQLCSAASHVSRDIIFSTCAAGCCRFAPPGPQAPVLLAAGLAMTLSLTLCWLLCHLSLVQNGDNTSSVLHSTVRMAVPSLAAWKTWGSVKTLNWGFNACTLSTLGCYFSYNQNFFNMPLSQCCPFRQGLWNLVITWVLVHVTNPQGMDGLFLVCSSYKQQAGKNIFAFHSLCSLLILVVDRFPLLSICYLLCICHLLSSLYMTTA